MNENGKRNGNVTNDENVNDMNDDDESVNWIDVVNYHDSYDESVSIVVNDDHDENRIVLVND